MVHKLYSIRDKVAKQYGPVFQAVNDGVASRQMTRLMESIPEYDRDGFELDCVGEFNDESGSIDAGFVTKVEYSIPRFEDVESRVSKFGSK